MWVKRCHQYIDETQLYLSIASDPKVAVNTLNRCLEEVVGRMMVNKLKLNPNMTESYWWYLAKF